MCLIYSVIYTCKGGPEAGFKVGISLAQVWASLDSEPAWGNT